MEKNIRKRVCRLAAVLSAGLVVLFGYWFFLNPHGYWQKVTIYFSILPAKK